MAIGWQGGAMGLAKRMLGDRHQPRGVVASNREGLMVKINGHLECIPIRKWAGKEAKLHFCQGGFRVMVEGGNYFAVAIKPKTKPQPWEVEKPIKLDPLGERFTQYFNFGSYAIVNNGEGWKTLQHRISTAKIWELWKDPTTAIGLRFGKETTVGLLDIDATGEYHNEADLQAMREALESIGIGEQVLIQSSYSGGWHLWFGFPQQVPTFALSCAVPEVLARFGFDISPGNLEIFPNRKGWTKGEITKYNGGRLPLQPGSGSALLDDDFAPYSQSLEVFLDQLEETAIACDIDLLLEACTEARANYNPFAKPNGFAPHNKKARQWKLQDAHAIAQPWEPHDSNTRLGIIARYGVVFERLTGDHLVNYIVQTAIGTPDYSKHCRHQGEIEAWASRWAHCAERKYYAYEPKKKNKPAGPSNDERKQAAMERLIEAMEDLKLDGKLPNGVKARERLLIQLIGISKSSLWKPEYLELWHPRFDPVLHGDRLPIMEEAQHQAQQGIESIAPHPPTKTLSCLSLSPTRQHQELFTLLLPGRDFSPELFLCAVLFFCASTKTKMPQSHTGREIDAFSIQNTVLIKPRLAIVNNSESQAQRQFQPSVKPGTRIINRPVLVPITDDPNLQGLKPGDWVIEPDRPDRLMKLASIDGDGIWCRLHKPDCQSPGLIGSLAYLPELQHAPPELIAEYFPNGDRTHQPNGGTAHG
ncbi:hypothetical protein [Synechocystis sp. LEGE 06083]|uniref:hypothetical protein n=1 Tax=Synechocystis sp. LEGE 06083 TaxID=915336 RepID=UPI001D14B452|nr:hypothetical protein [Synechocystis sp. LEGE 06083]